MTFQEKLLEHLKQELRSNNDAYNQWSYGRTEYDHQRDGKCEVLEDLIEWVENEMKSDAK